VVQGFRQPGSAWKPVLYATAIDNRAITAGTVILDVTTRFAGSWVPKNAMTDERGPVLARKALQYSLNIPAIRVMDRVTPQTVGQYAARAGIQFLSGRKSMVLAGLAGAIGTVETRMLDLTAAYGSFGNDGFVTTPRFILEIKDSEGRTIFEAGKPQRTKFISPQAAFIVADILAGNTNPAVNIYWGPKFQLTNGPGGSYRTAALKTGTTNDIRDLSAYGLLPAPEAQKDPAIALGVWMGNSDHSQPTLGGNPLFASDGPALVWKAFLRDYMRGEPTPTFKRPNKGLVQTTIDAYSGGRPGPWTRDTVSEWFIAGTEPGSRGQIDKAGLIYVQDCGTWMVDPLRAENRNRDQWKDDVRSWIARARMGTGVRSSTYGTTTRFLEARSSWGGPIVGPCPTPPPTPAPTPVAPAPTADPGGEPEPRPVPERTPRPTPRPTPKPQKTPRAINPVTPAPG
jgi:penicillin-binding protein 1A